MRIIAYSTHENSSGVCLEESTGEGIVGQGAGVILEWLMSGRLAEIDDNPKLAGSTVRVCWSLDDTLAPILKLLGRRACEILYKTKKLYLAPYKLFYIPGKLFALQDVRVAQGRLEVFDLGQYFTTEPYQTKVDEIQMYGMELYKVLGKMGFYPKRLVSPVKIFEEWVLDHCDLPTGWDIPKEAAEYAWMCSGKLWIEAHQLGYFKDTHDYDMASAFPNVMTKLYDTRKCDWVEDREYHPEAVYGYCKGRVTIEDKVMVSPIIYTGENGYSYSAVGTWETYLTKEEIDFIMKWNIGEFEVEQGYWAIPKAQARKLPQPLEHIVTRLLEQKKEGGLAGDLAKRMSVGLYGKLGEEHDTEFGEHFSPCWFAEISTQTRLAVAEWLYRHCIGPGGNEGHKSLVHISVDGALLNKEINDTGGGWKLSRNGEALVISSGLVYLGRREPKGLSLEDILGMVKKHPKVAYYQKLIKRRVTLGQALELDFAELGKEVDMHTSVDLNMVHDRDFGELPRTGGQLLSKKFGSKPLKVEE